MRRSVLIFAAFLLAMTAFGMGCQQQEGAAEETLDPNKLQLTDTVMGEGAEAQQGDFLSVHYTGWLYVDGQKGEKFDSSVDRNEPFSFRLGQGRVIRGWDEGFAGMKIGGKRTLIIPPDMAYGDRDRPSIPAGSTLIFEVELLEVPRVQSETLTVGEGPVAEEGDAVEVHYTGWISEDGQKGKKFDSSLDRNQPFRFTLGGGQVIPGWDMGVKGMKVGEKRVLTIPHQLAYGARGVQRGGEVIIPPSAVLIFEVELLGVEGKL